MAKKKTKRWSVNATVVGGKHLGIFEAATAEEAVEKAIEAHEGINLCFHCSHHCENADIEDVTAEPADEE
jgi:hypothetical protein